MSAAIFFSRSFLNLTSINKKNNVECKQWTRTPKNISSEQANIDIFLSICGYVANILYYMPTLEHSHGIFFFTPPHFSLSFQSPTTKSMCINERWKKKFYPEQAKTRSYMPVLEHSHTIYTMYVQEHWSRGLFNYVMTDDPLFLNIYICYLYECSRTDIRYLLYKVKASNKTRNKQEKNKK